MTYTTEILENESGIQYQGVKDKSGSTGTYPITGLIMGIFKRGRFDKPMTITNENIRAQLGYDPLNSYYIAVQDVLNSGVPSVQVLRMKDVCTCDAEYVDIPHYYQAQSYGTTRYEIIVNGTKYSTEDNASEISSNRGINGLFAWCEELRDLLSVMISSDEYSTISLGNLTNSCLTLKVTAQYKQHGAVNYGAVITLLPRTSLCASTLISTVPRD